MQCNAMQGKEGQGWAGQGRAGQGRSGQGKARQDQAPLARHRNLQQLVSFVCAGVTPCMSGEKWSSVFPVVIVALCVQYANDAIFCFQDFQHSI